MSNMGVFYTADDGGVHFWGCGCGEGRDFPLATYGYGEGGAAQSATADYALHLTTCGWGRPTLFWQIGATGCGAWQNPSEGTYWWDCPCGARSEQVEQEYEAVQWLHTHLKACGIAARLLVVG